jgi:hypothetical protein
MAVFLDVVACSLEEFRTYACGLLVVTDVGNTVQRLKLYTHDRICPCPKRMYFVL